MSATPPQNNGEMVHHGAEFDAMLDEIRADAERRYAGFEAMPAETWAQVQASAAQMGIEIKSKRQAAQIFAWANRLLGFVGLFA